LLSGKRSLAAALDSGKTGCQKPMQQRPLTDTYRHQGLRKKLVETVRKKGITDERILDAIGQLPRHFFLDKAFEELAYEDKALPIDAGQTISQPYTVAYQTQLLDVKKGDKVLEIGTGSGYQACVLELIGAKVYSIERQESLFHKTKALLTQMGFTRIQLFFRDGFIGIPEIQPFDRILVTCGASELPEVLMQQLRIGAKMVIPVGEGVQRMIRITRRDAHHFDQEFFDDFRFVPMLGGVVTR
jgi:protein-L-isoaspartate(D-aspartate) O-methyltransferase